MRVGKSMTDVVGGTPLVQLHKVVPDDAADVFVKLEWFNRLVRIRIAWHLPWLKRRNGGVTFVTA